MSERAKSYLLYVRQSLTRDVPDESLSLVAQERSLRDLVARSKGVVLEPVIIDADQKGWDPHRPGIAELIRRTETERPDFIGVYALSRFARDYWLAEGLWRKLTSLQPKLEIVSMTEPNAQDDLVRGILGVVSEAERKRMGHFLKMAWAERARQGKPHGPVTFGYTKDDDGRLVIDETARPWVEAIYRHAENGWSLRRIALWLRDTAPPVRKWEPNTVKNLLTTPIMAGGVRTAETLVWDAHEPIIPRDRWEAVQQLLTARQVIRTKHADSWLEGILFCGCGARMALILARTPRRGYPDGIAQFRCLHAPSHGYFRGSDPPRCDNDQRFIVQAKAERLAVATLTADLARVLDWEAVVVNVEAQQRAGQKDLLKERTRLERQRATISERRDRTLTLYQLNKLDVARWEAEDARLAGELAAFDAAVAALPSPPDPAIIRQRVATLAGVRDDLPALIAADPLAARRFMQRIGAHFVVRRAGVTIDWPAGYAILFDRIHGA